MKIILLSSSIYWGGRVCVCFSDFSALFSFHCPFLLHIWSVLKSALALGLRGLFWLVVWPLWALISASHFFFTRVYKRMAAWASWTYNRYMQAYKYTENNNNKIKVATTQSPWKVLEQQDPFFVVFVIQWRHWHLRWINEHETIDQKFTSYIINKDQWASFTSSYTSTSHGSSCTMLNLWACMYSVSGC